MNRFCLFLVLFVLTLSYCNTKEQEVLPEELVVLDSLYWKYQNGDTLGSLDGMNKFVQDYPNADYGYVFLSSIYLALDKDSLALIFIEDAVALNPNNYGALTNYGIVLDKRSEFEKAFQYYTKAIEIKPDFIQAYSNLMGNRISVGDLENALKFGEKAVDYGNQTSDKAVLCAIYHKMGLDLKRDSLYNELKNLNYVNIDKLDEIIYDH